MRARNSCWVVICTSAFSDKGSLNMTGCAQFPKFPCKWIKGFFSVVAFRQGTPGSRATRSPTERVLTSAPTAETAPEDSWSSTMGLRRMKLPMEPCYPTRFPGRTPLGSLPQGPKALTAARIRYPLRCAADKRP